MSNRGDFVGTAPNSGNYIPAPVPADKEDLPVYVNDELLRLGGTVNGVLEGGALPPHSELPKRFREGMIMNFSQAVSDDIYSSGVWLYKNAKWWKLIDDPTEIGLSKFIYLTTPDSTQPATPAPSADTPPGWSAAPTVKADKSDWIWVSSNIDFDFKTKVYTWSEPVAWSAGVADGGAGESFETWFADSSFRPETPTGYPPVGSDGVIWSDTPATNEGAIIWAVTALVDPSDPESTVWTFPVRWNGSSGSEGQRGFLGINVPGTVWSDEVAWDAIVQETQGLTPNRPIPWDNVTIYDNNTSFVETKRFVSGANRPGVWEPVAQVIDGDLIVRGTVATDALRANAVTTDKLAAGAVSADKVAANAITGVKIDSATTIRAGTGNQSASLDGADSKWRIYAGSSTPANAPFRVDKDGNLFATTGSFGGTIYADKVEGDFTSVAIKKIPDRFAPFSGGTGGIITPKELFKIRVERKPYVRYVKIDPVSFDFEQNRSKSAYHMLAHGIKIDSSGNTVGPQQELVGNYDAYWWQDSVEGNETNYGPSITVQIPANVDYQVTVSIGVESSSNGGHLWQQDLTCTLFKQGTELSFA